MIPEREAVQAALDYMRSVYSQELQDLALEEIEQSDDGKCWLVTLGFWQPKPKTPLDKEIEKQRGLVLTLPAAEVMRVYKVVSVDAASGKPYSMKIREL